MGGTAPTTANQGVQTGERLHGRIHRGVQHNRAHGQREWQPPGGPQQTRRGDRQSQAKQPRRNGTDRARGIGLRSVRSILASRWASMTWFSTLADAAANAVRSRSEEGFSRAKDGSHHGRRWLLWRWSKRPRRSDGPLTIPMRCGKDRFRIGVGLIHGTRRTLVHLDDAFRRPD